MGDSFSFIDTIIGFLIAIFTILLSIERDVTKYKEIEIDVAKDKRLIFEWNSRYYKDKKIWIDNIGERTLFYNIKLKELDLEQSGSVGPNNIRSIKFKEIFDEYEPTGRIEIYGYTKDDIEKVKVKFFYVGKISRLGQFLSWLEN